MSLDNVLERVAVWVVYPLVMLITIAIYYELLRQGIDLKLAGYVAAIMGGAGLIALLEKYLPYRKAWTPDRTEVKTDVTFMLLIQILLPTLLTLMATFWLLDYLKSTGLVLYGLWPHSLPIWIQMLLMMFLADLPRYWLHRAAHEWTPLWRFHAVHHSVKKLNWINVGRFHPIDKALQFLCDALPFILMGVSQEVLSLYFVVYSVKGFFQHSNVDIRLGWLNYIISGPELHRWHHSKVVHESNTNYGNNIIVWDILFGTFFRPTDTSVGDLGLISRCYPMGFIRQMGTPFVRGLDRLTQDEIKTS